MEINELEKVLEYVQAVQDATSPTISKGSALMLISELKLTAADKLPAMCQQLDLVDVVGRKVSYEDTFNVVYAAIRVIVDAENGDKISGSM